MFIIQEQVEEVGNNKVSDGVGIGCLPYFKRSSHSGSQCSTGMASWHYCDYQLSIYACLGV